MNFPQPKIKTLSPKKLIGVSVKMSFSNNRTFELWNGFMTRRKEIKNAIGTELFSLQDYDPTFSFQNFDPHKQFEKWAALEVESFSEVPQGMKILDLPGGLYAVFDYKGAAAEAELFFRYIFGTWLPGSEYETDHRIHFEVLGEKYKKDSVDSEEEIWIPIRKKA